MIVKQTIFFDDKRAREWDECFTRWPVTEQKTIELEFSVSKQNDLEIVIEPLNTTDREYAYLVLHDLIDLNSIRVVFHGTY